MYSRPKSEQYDSAWLRAERDLATKYSDLPWSPDRIPQEVSPKGEDTLGPQPFSKDDYIVLGNIEMTSTLFVNGKEGLDLFYKGIGESGEDLFLKEAEFTREWWPK